MKFGPVSLAEAQGAILAHSLDLDGHRLRKGRVLGPGDLARMAAHGVASVIVARLDPGDVAEDAAAARIGAALAAPGLRIGAAATGRVNVMASGPGVAGIGAVGAVNAVDPMITLATVPAWQRVAEGDMIATVKIIAYGVSAKSVERAALAATGALRLYPPTLRTACLIETTISRRPPAIKGRTETEARLARLGVALGPRCVVAHDTASVAAALRAATADLVLILTASATSDCADVGPAAVVEAGGGVLRFGMPVDPGNLLFLGTLGARPVIGLPGCARSPALNGADWVLERTICGIALTGADLGAMGVGGLLKEVVARGRPRAG